VNIVKRLCRLAAVMGISGLAAGLVMSGGRVNEICVISGEIDYCIPRRES
jgi:hypothetical protein